MNDFLKKAEALKPVLNKRVITKSCNKVLCEGESFVVDMGEHIVGYVGVDFAYSGNYPDAPAVIEVYFAESMVELENAQAYCGWLPSGWLQQEMVRIFLPEKLRFKSRYAVRYIKFTAISLSGAYSAVVKKINITAVTSAPEKIEPCGKTDMEKAIDGVALKTLSECMQYEFEDGVKRDGRLWIADLRLQALANYRTFKHNDLVKRCLYLFAGTAKKDGGLCQSVFCGKKIVGDEGTNFDYPLLFVSALRDYYKETGDSELIKELTPTAKRQVELSRRYFADDMIKGGEIGWCFMDWSFTLNREVGAQALYICAEKALIDILTAVGEDPEEFTVDVKRKSSSLIAKFYDEKIGLFVSGNDRQISYISNIWAVLAEVFDDNENASLLKRLLSCDEALKPVTPYAIHYLLQAMCSSGMTDEAEKYMLSYWGKMVKSGADTFWEVYDENDEKFSPYGGVAVNSFCHAWSCTPSYFIRKYFCR